jgi:aminoglycoside phosphotransferase (APT) family kinase protein
MTVEGKIMREQNGPVLAEEMRDWIERTTGSAVVSATRQAGGGRNEGWFVELKGSDAEPRRVFFRWDRSDPDSTGDPWTIRREAEIYRALSTTSIPVASFVAVHPTDQAMLLSVVEGDGRFSRVTDLRQSTSIAQDFIRHLAALHAVDVHALGLACANDRRTLAELAVAQLDEMTALIEFRGGVPDALLGLALTWLRSNVPDHEGRPVLVQGDTGPGNFMYDGDRVSAIVDWELAHLGDPMDDLAWVSLRSVQDPFPDLPERFAEYERASGEKIDLARIRYYRVLAEAKIMVMGHGRTVEVRVQGPDGNTDGGGDPGARLIFGQLHRRLLVEALADVMDVVLTTPSLPTGDEPGEWHSMYRIVLDQMRSVIAPRITDGFALQRAKGLARAIKYLEAVDRSGRVFAEAELDDLESLLGERPPTTRDGRRRLAESVDAGALDAAVVLGVIHRRTCRDDQLLRESSGALADRHYDPLERFGK